MPHRDRLIFQSPCLSAWGGCIQKVAVGGGGGEGGGNEGCSLALRGPIKITALKLIFTAHPVSAEQKPVKRRFSSAESITGRDLKMCLSSVLIEHTRSMNIRLFGCEIISTKLVMFNLTVEWRFSNLGLNLNEEWRTGKPNSKFDPLMASPLQGGKSRRTLSHLCLRPSETGPMSPALSSALRLGRENHTRCMLPEPKRGQQE